MHSRQSAIKQRERLQTSLKRDWLALASGGGGFVLLLACLFSKESFSHLPKLRELELQLFQGLVSRDILRGIAGLALCVQREIEEWGEEGERER